MLTRDNHNNLHPVPLFAPKAAVADNTAQVSSIIDTNGYESCEFLLITGNNTDTDATSTVLVEGADASDMTGAVAVDDAHLLGTEAAAAFTFADDGECRKIGVTATYRYYRLTVTPVGNSSTFFLAGIAVLGHPRNAPTPALT